MSDTIVTSAFTLFDSASKERLSFNVGKGALYIGIRNEKDRIFNRSLSVELCRLIIEECKKLRDAGPNTKVPVIVEGYNRDDKKWFKDYVLVFVKDESGIFRVEVQSGKDSVSSRYVFMITKGITIGTDPMKDHVRSMYKFNEFIDWLEHIVPYERMFTRPSFSDFKNKKSDGGSKQNRSESDSSESEYF